MSKAHFRVSSGLKTLIGSELITDKNVAIFELVKNSFDADATEVSIRFENLKVGVSKIIISDNGKGMTYDDLMEKWLFVAFSAKRDGTEDINQDYRNKVKASKHYAGAKGVGRFSSDRLGKKLTIYSKSKKPGSKVERLIVNWKLFDIDQYELFQKIPAIHETIQSNPYNIKHGTVLEITELNNQDWTREELKRLKDKLSKLVRPDLNRSMDDRKFKVVLEVPEEEQEDKEKVKLIPKDELWHRYRESVNGEIKNFVFDLLNIKTTKIHSKIASDGTIITELIDREKSIYKIEEEATYNELKNVEITLYYMGRAAKVNFANLMGIDVVNYGNIFLYKNGFRIMPYGEPRDDSFGIDARGMQGIKRHLTTRTCIGQVEIHGDSLNFKESTSRDGGLVKTKSYYELVTFLLDTLRRLEKYVVEVANWGLDDEELRELNENDYKKKLVELLANVSTDKSVLKLTYNKDIVNIVNTQEEKSAKRIIRNFKRIGFAANDKRLLKDAEKLEKEWTNLRKDNDAHSKKTENLEKELGYTIEQNSFLEDSVKADTKEFQSLLHHTEKSTYWINKYLDNLIKHVEQGASKEKLFEIISLISLENHKIFSFTKYHKSTKFNTFVDKINQDIVSFINEYVNNVCKYYQEYENLSIAINTPAKLTFKKEFAPVEIPIIFDNLLNNSKKAKASKILLTWEEVSGKEVKLYFSDNGHGVDNAVSNRIFDFRFSTTKGGSGLGLFHVKEVLKKMKSDIDLNQRKSKGAEFIITLKK